MQANARALATVTERAREAWRPSHLGLLLPALLILIVFFVYPVLGVVYRSVYRNGFTLQFYQKMFQSSVYVTVIWLTFRTASLVTLICLVLGYPLAYFLTGVGPATARILMALVIFPFFTSVIVRTYSWMVLLGRSGFVNASLLALGVTSEPLRFLHNQTGVLIGMTYVLLPFMVLTLYSVMRGIDPDLVRAAHSVGATRFMAFRRIFLPLSLPGIVGGGLLVFILSLGFFITPALMGGPSDVMIAMLIQREVELTVNWSFASALAVALLALTLAGFLLGSRVVGVNRLFGGRA